MTRDFSGFFDGDEVAVPERHGPFKELFFFKQGEEGEPDFFPSAVFDPLGVAAPAGDVGTHSGGEVGPLAAIKDDEKDAVNDLAIVDTGPTTSG